MNTTFTDKDVTCTDTFVFFWRGWLCQWHRSPFTIDATQYNCCEQFMMAEKTRIFGDGFRIRHNFEFGNFLLLPAKLALGYRHASNTCHRPVEVASTT